MSKNIEFDDDDDDFYQVRRTKRAKNLGEWVDEPHYDKVAREHGAKSRASKFNLQRSSPKNSWQDNRKRHQDIE